MEGDLSSLIFGGSKNKWYDHDDRILYKSSVNSVGSWIFDFWVRVELNLRFREYWDVKFFHNGRPGVMAWTLMYTT